MKQNTQKGTYVTIRIHKHNNTKYIVCKIKQKHTKHKTTAHSPQDVQILLQLNSAA